MWYMQVCACMLHVGIYRRGKAHTSSSKATPPKSLPIDAKLEPGIQMPETTEGIYPSDQNKKDEIIQRSQ